MEPTSPNTLIALAAKAGSTAADGDTGNSPFAAALVKYLPRSGDVRRAFGFVRDDVLKITGNRQEPYVYGTLGGEDLPLVAAKSVDAAVPPDPTADIRRPRDRRDRRLVVASDRARRVRRACAGSATSRRISASREAC